MVFHGETFKEQRLFLQEDLLSKKENKLYNKVLLEREKELKLVNQQVQRALKEQQKIQKAAENERKRILGAQKKQRIIDNKNETKIKNSSCACAIVTCMAVRVASNANTFMQDINHMIQMMVLYYVLIWDVSLYFVVNVRI